MEDRTPRVVRVCSVFEPPRAVLTPRGALFDPIGGMQNHTAQLTRSLAARGIRHTVLTSRPPGAPRRHHVAPGAEVLRSGWPIRRFRQLYSVGTALKLLRLPGRVDLVHAHLGEDIAVLPLAMMEAKRKRCPFVITVHCSLAHTAAAAGMRGFALRTLGVAMERRGERSAQAIIVLTDRLQRLLVQSGVPSERVHVIPSGVDPSLFTGPFDDPLPQVPKPRVVFVGRLVAMKGIRELVRAFSTLQRAASLVFVGDGPARRNLERDIRDLGLHEATVITGFQHHDDVPAFLAHADVLVVPSYYEELGSVLLEGMWLGVPVVASRTGGIPTIVRDGVEGFLVEPRDVPALSKAIAKLLDDRSLARAMGDAGARRAKKHSWDALSERVLDVYEQIWADVEATA